MNGSISNFGAHRRAIITLLAWICAVPAAATEGFVPDDRLISDPTIDLVDPEFDATQNLMTWQDRQGNLWLADLDPLTGNIIPTTGQGLLLDTGLANIASVGNGPEFAYGDSGTSLYLVYTTVIQSKRALAVAIRGSEGGWVTSPLGMPVDRYRPLGTGTEHSGPMRLAYTRRLDDVMQGVAWRVWNEPTSEQTFTDAGGAGGRWIPGMQAFISPKKDEDGFTQLLWVDTDTGTVTQITSSPEDKVAPFAFEAPEFGNELVISALVDGRTVGLWRRTGVDDTWEQVNSLALPSQYEFASSPEPFTSDGKSYVAVIATESIGVGQLPYVPTGPGEVWIAALDPANPFFRQIDGGEPEGAVRSEPEPFETPDGPVIYYTQQQPLTGRALLRLAATGLGQPVAVDTDEDGAPDEVDNCTLIANADQRDTNADGFGNVCDADLDGDCAVSFTDLATLKGVFFGTDPDADFDGDGSVSFSDLGIMKAAFFGTPGPSAMAACP